jgi:hypothetical protein
MSIPPTLLTSASFALLTAALYVYLGWRLRERVVSSSEARVAWNLFVTWWIALAATTLISGVLNLLGAFNLASLSVFITMTYINVLIICVALWSLLYYLTYLFTGNNRSLVPISVFCAVNYALLVYYITASMPTGVTVGRWSTSIEYSNRITGPFLILVLMLILVPQMIGALAYFTLFFRVKDATQKFRILLVSMSIFVWFGSSLVASLTGVSDFDWWQIASRAIRLGSTLTILMAYFPPLWIKQRYKIVSMGEETGRHRKTI